MYCKNSGQCLLQSLNAEDVAKYSCADVFKSVDSLAEGVINCSARAAIYACVKPSLKWVVLLISVLNWQTSMDDAVVMWCGRQVEGRIQRLGCSDIWTTGDTALFVCLLFSACNHCSFIKLSRVISHKLSLVLGKTASHRVKLLYWIGSVWSDLVLVKALT